MTKRLLSILILFALLFSFVSCGENSFTCGELTLTLPRGYTERERPDGANMLLSDGKSTVTFRRISFIDAESEGIPTGLSDGEFAEYFLEKSGISGVISSYNTTPYYTYYNKSEGVRLLTMCAFLRTPYSYFVIVFATADEREEKGREDFFFAIDSIKINIVD